MNRGAKENTRIRNAALVASLNGTALMLAAALSDALGWGHDLSSFGAVQTSIMLLGLTTAMAGIIILWDPLERVALLSAGLKQAAAASSRDKPIVTAGLIICTGLFHLLAAHFYSEIQGQAAIQEQSTKFMVGSVLLEDNQPIGPTHLSVAAIPLADSLDLPIGIANAGDGTDRLFIVQKWGQIRILERGILLQEPFLDIRDRLTGWGFEQGLLGLAFDPNYEHNGYFYVNYTDRQGDTVIARYKVSNNPSKADPRTEIVLLKLDQPEETHNGGDLAFGPDGYLYVSLGDGGGIYDGYRHAQNGRTLLGSILRLDVSQLPYRVPDDNPYVGNTDFQDEIWVNGLRNPWQISFDQLTGELYFGDVGQDGYEEINVVRAGEKSKLNFGWPLMEGFGCSAGTICELDQFDKPLIAYDHQQGCSVTGGYVYRGSWYPTLQGKYLFADFCTGRLWAFQQDHPAQIAQVQTSELGITGLSSFGEDEAGELYVVSMNEGVLYRLAATVSKRPGH